LPALWLRRRILTTLKGALEEAPLVPLVAEEETPLVEEAEARPEAAEGKAPLVEEVLLLLLLQHLPEAAMAEEETPLVAEAVALLRRSPPTVMAEVAEARGPSRVPRRRLLLLLAEEVPLAVEEAAAARTTRRLPQRLRRRPNRRSLRIRAPLEVGKLLRRAHRRGLSLPPRRSRSELTERLSPSTG
jgi:hypothetical protein